MANPRDINSYKTVADIEERLAELEDALFAKQQELSRIAFGYEMGTSTLAQEHRAKAEKDALSKEYEALKIKLESPNAILYLQQQAMIDQQLKRILAKEFEELHQLADKYFNRLKDKTIKILETIPERLLNALVPITSAGSSDATRVIEIARGKNIYRIDFANLHQSADLNKTNHRTLIHKLHPMIKLLCALENNALNSQDKIEVIEAILSDQSAREDVSKPRTEGKKPEETAGGKFLKKSDKIFEKCKEKILLLLPPQNLEELNETVAAEISTLCNNFLSHLKPKLLKALTKLPKPTLQSLMERGKANSDTLELTITVSEGNRSIQYPIKYASLTKHDFPEKYHYLIEKLANVLTIQSGNIHTIFNIDNKAVRDILVTHAKSSTRMFVHTESDDFLKRLDKIKDYYIRMSAQFGQLALTPSSSSGPKPIK